MEGEGLTLITDGKRFYCVCSYPERTVPKSVGFRFEFGPLGQRRGWYTESAETASRLIQYADDETRATLQGIADERARSTAASRATDADIEIPAPEGITYFGFQKAAVKYALEHRATFLGDSMGLGKTWEALGVLSVTQEWPAVVIAPASLKLNWAREAKRLIPDCFPVPLATRKQSELWPLPPKALIICNYDILQAWLPAIRQVDPQTIIIDEIHFCKSSKAARSKAVKELCGTNGKRIMALSGTPFLNRPQELVFPLEILGMIEEFGGAWKFLRRYCNAHQKIVNRRGKMVWDFSGASNLSELQELLRKTCLIRRLKTDVLRELPAILHQVIEIPPTPEMARFVVAEEDGYQRHEDAIEELRVAVELAKASEDPEDYRKAIAKLTKGVNAAFTEIAKLRHDTAMCKVPLVAEHVRNALEEGSKVVVWCHHHDVGDAFMAEFPGLAVLHRGGLSEGQKDEAIRRFQNDPEVRLFVGSIQASGVGITLTASSHEIFAELDYVPANISQAIARCHRIGTLNPVLVQYLVLDGSLDAKMAWTLVEKQKVFDAALDDKIEFTMPVTPAKEQPATGNTSRQQIEKDAETMTAAQIQAVHTALRTLAGVCDGAWLLDGHGFNRVDARIGHSLAAAPCLTPRQAALGRRLLKKYARQLGEEIINAMGEKQT